MKGFSGMSGVKAEQDLKNEMGTDQQLGGRWKGMTLSQFDANVKEERASIGDDPETLKAFNERQARLRTEAMGAPLKKATHTMPDGTVMPGAKHRQ